MPELKEFAVRAYRVSILDHPENKMRLMDGFEDLRRDTPLTDAIRKAEETSLEERNFSFQGKSYRLERAKKMEKIILLNFVMSSYEGPVKTTPTEPVSSIGLEEEESFGHETAALYDPERERILIENNRPGTGITAMQAYFGNSEEKPNTASNQ